MNLSLLSAADVTLTVFLPSPNNLISGKNISLTFFFTLAPASALTAENRDEELL